MINKPYFDVYAGTLIEDRSKNVGQIQGIWNTTGQTDFSNITLPVYAGDVFIVSGTGTTIGGVQWNIGDYLLITSDISSTGTISTSDVQKMNIQYITTNSTHTLTNKTLSADLNTISDLEIDNFKNTAIHTIVGQTPIDTALLTEKATDDLIDTLIVDSLGKFIQYDMEGYLSEGRIIFEPHTGETVTLENNKYYEFDLVLQLVGIIPDNTPLLIFDGENYFTIQSALGNATFGNLRQIMAENEETGFRWIFEGTVGIADNVHNITIGSGIINPENLDLNCLTKLSNQNLLDIITDNGVYKGRHVQDGECFMCSDDNGYQIGHIYQFKEEDGNVYSWIDTTASGLTRKLTFTNPELILSGNTCVWNLTHALGTADFIVGIRTVATGENVVTSYAQNENQMVIEFDADANISANTYKVTIIG